MTEKQDAAPASGAEAPTSKKEIESYFRGRVKASERALQEKLGTWRRNIEARIGKFPSLYSDGVAIMDEDVQVEINPDWWLTKTKTANLFSLVPEVRLTHENTQYAAALGPFAKEFNYELSEKRCNVGVAMHECMNDVVNATGVAGMIVGWAARFEKRTVPKGDYKMLPPDAIAKGMKLGVIPTEKVDFPVDSKFYMERISPSDLITPVEFTGSDFDKGDFVGNRGTMSWAEGKNELRLTDAQKEDVLGATSKHTNEDLRADSQRNVLAEVRGVRYTQIFYWRHRVDPKEMYFSAIWRIVWVDGLEDPVIHEAWKGQQFDEQGKSYVGSCKFPVRVCTLTYITDNPLVPSDTEAGRSQVNDLRRSRSQMFMNRDRSRPIRWFDVNRVDPMIQASLLRGTWQNMIPTNGDGSKAIGEIARASYPSEDIAFDRATMQDLRESWQLGANQGGVSAGGEQTATETTTVQQNFATVIGQERGRAASFFLGACEVLAGLMALHSEFKTLTTEEKQRMQQAWDNKHILHDLVMKIRPDSTIMIDVEQKIQRLNRALNMTVKSGYVNPAPVIAEIWELSGVDPATVMIKPPEKPPEDPNVSYRFSGKDDLSNPMVVAMLLNRQLAPSIEQIEAAKKLLLAAQLPPSPASAEPAPGGPAPAGGPEAPGPQPPGPGAAGPAEEARVVQPNEPAAHPDWHTATKVAQRSQDAEAGGGE